ncbi:MAG: SusC/RagA family TonB-linked outer membrane protein [Bacteroidota bacterium]
MSRLAIYLFVFGYSMTMVCGTELDAQRKRLNEINFEIERGSYSMQELFSKIEYSSNFKLAFLTDDEWENQTVTIESNQWVLQDLLEHLSSTWNVSFKRVNETISISKIDQSKKSLEPVVLDQISISGTITDENGEPLPGAAIQEKGTSNGTITNVDGAYTLNISEDAVLIFSFVGYQTLEIPVNGKSKIDVSLAEDISALEEVVVVGYGTQKKSDVTGAVASLSKDRLEMMPNLNISQAIMGAIPGVMVQTNTAGANPSQSILVRGRNSITANNDPLIILDGIPYSGNLTDINPNDISSIEVLKDASAAAIYGSRGSNGVILITTKEGVEGKTVITYSGRYSVTDVTKVSRQLTGPEFYDFKITRNAAAMTLSEEEVYNDGTWTNWTDLALRTGHTQEHNLSISGGSEKTKFYIGGGYLNVKGVAKNDDFERLSTRFNLETKITDWLSIGTRSQITIDDASGSEANFEVALETNPLGLAYDEYGNYTIFPWPDNIIVGNPLGPLLYDDLEKSYQAVSNNYMIIDVPFIEGLSYRLNTGLRFRFTDRGNYQPRTTQSGFADLGDGSVDNSLYNNTIVENILTYKRDFGAHSIFVTGLYSYQGDQQKTNSVDATKYPNDFLSWYASGQAINRELSYSFSETALVSQMLRFNYSYDSRYLATFTIRRDGYSGFGEDNKWGSFPSIALGWNIANESFFNGVDFFSQLKLRGSLGLNGNQAIGAYESLSKFNIANYTAGTEVLIGYKPSKLGLDDLGWESSRTINLGVDYEIRDGRISGNVDWYFTNTFDLLLNRSISVIHGITPGTHLPDWVHPAVTENIGETQNTGIEVLINSRNVINPKFKWSTSGNISFNKNKIVSLYGYLDENGNETDDISNQWFIGQPIRVNYDYVWDGVWQLDEVNEADVYGSKPGWAKLKDVDGDGELTGEDRQIIGQSDPKIIWGLTNTFTYGPFKLNVFVHGVHGRTTRNYLMNDNVQGAEVRYNTLKKNWWTPENPTNEWVKNELLATQMGGASAHIYEISDYVRIRDVTLSYDLPENILGKVGIDKLAIYFTGRNLLTFTQWTGMDPALVDEDSQQGIPMQKEYVFGLNLGF